MSSRIIVLDSHTLTPTPSQPGEVNWSAMAELGELVNHERTPTDAVVERCAGAQAAITNKAVLDEAAIAALPDLKYIGVTATGTNVVDLAAATRHGITVTNVPGYGAPSVAQHVFALLLELTNHVAAHDRAVRPSGEQGGWPNHIDWSFTVAPMTELDGKTLAIVGMGSIGRRVARIGAAMGMKIVAAHQRSMNKVKLHGIDIEWLPVDELIVAADVLTLHCPLTDETKHMVNTSRLSSMKSSALLINTGRGPLIDESALADALSKGQIAGAAVDVLSTEPPAVDNPLLGAPNMIITPHNAWASREARQRLMDTAVENLRAFLDGEPVNVANG